MMTTMLENDGAHEAFVASIIWVATSDSIVQELSILVVKEERLMALVVKFLAEQAKEKGGKAAQQLVAAAPLSLSPLPSDTSSSRNYWKRQLHRKPPHCIRTSTYFMLDDRKNWSRWAPLWRSIGQRLRVVRTNHKKSSYQWFFQSTWRLPMHLITAPIDFTIVSWATVLRRQHAQPSSPSNLKQSWSRASLKTSIWWYFSRF